MPNPDRNLTNPSQTAIKVEVHPTSDSSGALTHAATTSTVGDSATSTQLIAASTSRTGLSIRNDSTARLYIEPGATATTSSVIYLDQGDIYEFPILANGEIYRGIVTGIWASDAGGSAYVCQNA